MFYETVDGNDIDKVLVQSGSCDVVVETTDGEQSVHNMYTGKAISGTMFLHFSEIPEILNCSVFNEWIELRRS